MQLVRKTAWKLLYHVLCCTRKDFPLCASSLISTSMENDISEYMSPLKNKGRYDFRHKVPAICLIKINLKDN